MRDAPLYCIRIGYLTCKHDAILSVYTTPSCEVHILRPLLLWSDCIGQQGKPMQRVGNISFLISPKAQTITATCYTAQPFSTVESDGCRIPKATVGM